LRVIEKLVVSIKNFDISHLFLLPFIRRKRHEKISWSRVILTMTTYLFMLFLLMDRSFAVDDKIKEMASFYVLIHISLISSWHNNI
jgi:hypothetical protein